MAAIRQISSLDVLFLLCCCWLVYKLFHRIRRNTKTVRLNGPQSKSWIFGVGKYVSDQPDSGAVYEKWASEYGPVYEVPAGLGSRKVILTDTKAISHFFSKETTTYVHTPHAKLVIEGIVGRGLLWADGESHKRQRKAVSPAFSNAAIRRLTSVFYDSGYKLKEAWDGILQSSSSDEVIIEVQSWMNRVSLDSIGIAGFGHDFGALRGKESTVAQVFDAFNTLKPSFFAIVGFILGPTLPILAKLPTERRALTMRWTSSVAQMAAELLERVRKENEEGVKTEEKSIIGLLLKAESADSDLRMTQEEVMAQMKVLILAGYETTSISLTWALVELCKKPETQAKLREELLTRFPTSDPSWDQLMGDLPFLDGVVHEVLRLHPPVDQAGRVASEDDVIPLSAPITAGSGEAIDRLPVGKGTLVTVPIACMNHSEAVWGPDAKEFVPERWLDNGKALPSRAQELQGHRHLLTFIDGPRICLGKNFALAEFKAVLSVLIRNYTFEFRDGPRTQVEKARAMLPRPQVVGETACRVPLRVRRVQ
ncbi:cytochrome P450 [Gloeophyllum trabeum ATCC 11539]|uniref:Cytochrome P450 n=1 Tax=Gloeophyllum trabeum (strain ATCC 11539 / FP-39264 / Madison 617) TaxID=670483 RepID=S7PWU0_GLOTA|nr:cytochrome P450 [Gloeophyllum trabeum ATCC 11539]EPQ51852.1 cytochrome P450 [Gloeophyllum trabeum ATCC 11539]